MSEGEGTCTKTPTMEEDWTRQCLSGCEAFKELQAVLYSCPTGTAGLDFWSRIFVPIGGLQKGSIQVTSPSEDADRELKTCSRRESGNKS